MPPISPTSQNWLATAAGTPTQYAPGLTPPNAQVLGASDASPISNTQIVANPNDAANAQAQADTLGYLNSQAGTLQSLLGRTDVNLNQGLTRVNDGYTSGVGNATSQRDTAVTGQNQAKQSAYNTINSNANTGYNSLAQIIGRAAGTGSSAYQDLLPNVVGQDTSTKRQGATDTYGQNLSNIDGSFQNSLASLMAQKKANEDSVRSNVENQRQTINGQLATNAAQQAQARGGGYAAVQAAEAPFQSAIENSRNSVQNFFDQFHTPYTAPVVNPNLAQYQTDRSAINANNSAPAADNSTPYTALLRKQLQGAA